MHELSVCYSLLDRIAFYAQEQNSDKVYKIILQIGLLSGVEPDLLENAYSIAKIGTIAENAELIIEILPIKVRCRICGQESQASPNKLICQHCGAWQTQVIQGEEMLLVRIEMEGE